MEEDEHLRYLSCGLYKIVTHEIGTEETIQIRRMMGKVDDELVKMDSMSTIHDQVRSGSRAEGFMFSTSDEDIMYVYKYIEVLIADTGRELEYRTRMKMETNQSRPGFCLLRLLSQGHRYDFDINQLCVSFRNGRYLSSTIWKERTASFFPEPTIHGPCESGINGSVECDIAHCLECSKWPKSAYPCLHRLIRRGWPSSQVVSRIIKNGCHVVPIGDKTSDTEEIEWRLSFSGAEKTLIHEMNHCQFLTYGLLKIFLKEAINTRQDVDDLICSYFLKTAVLWETVNSRQEWMEHDLLKWFWKCFRRLLSWVSHGYCPNFFIPENNMFLGKIDGKSQHVLLLHLTSFYKIGYKCILACKSLYRQFLPFLGHYYIGEICNCNLEISRLTECEAMRQVIVTFKCLYNIRAISKRIRFLRLTLSQSEPHNRYFIKCISILLVRYYQQLFFHHAVQCFNNFIFHGNRKRYQLNIKYINTMKQAKFDKSTHDILSTVLLYKQRMYYHVIRKANHIRERIIKPNVIYTWNCNHFQYQQLGGSHTPFDVMMKKFVVSTLHMNKHVCLPELYLEHSSTEQSIPYPPFVLLSFIMFMSYYQLSLFNEAQSELENLKICLINENYYYVGKIYEAISWEMLGICQETAGFYQDAFTSYHKALKEPFYNSFREATKLRIQNLATYMDCF